VQPCHPERSRSSGAAKDLKLDGVERQPNLNPAGFPFSGNYIQYKGLNKVSRIDNRISAETETLLIANESKVM